MQIAETRQKGIIFVKVFTETEAGIERDALTPHAGEHSGFGPLSELTFHQQHDIAGRRKGSPFFRASAHVHEDSTAF